MLAWINATLGTSYTNLNGAMQAFAVEQGFANWASMNTFSVSYTYVNAEAENLVLAFTSEPDDTRKALIDDTIGDLKASGVWAALDCIFILAAHHEQAARVDWKSPSRVAVAVNSPTFTQDRGFTGDGATSRLRTTYQPATHGVQFTQDAASIWTWSTTDLASNSGDAGANLDFGPRINSRSAANQLLAKVCDNTDSTTAVASSVGLSGASRVNSTTKRLWKNGAQAGSDFTVSSTGRTNSEQWICGQNASAFSSRRIAMAAWGGSLTGLEASMYTTINAYMTAVGAA